MAMTALPIQPIPVCVALLKGRLRHGLYRVLYSLLAGCSVCHFAHSRSLSPHNTKHFTSYCRAHGASRRSEIEKPRGSRTAPGRAWRRTERGLQVVEEVSVVYSNIEVRVKRAGPSGLGDLEVTEYIARIRIRSGPFEREDDASVHLATTEARFMPD